MCLGGLKIWIFCQEQIHNDGEIMGMAELDTSMPEDRSTISYQNILNRTGKCRGECAYLFARKRELFWFVA